MAMMRAVFASGAMLLAAAGSAETETGRGEYLVYAGGCIECHTAESDGAVPLAGGRELETPFGTFHVPNITPDAETGIGDWTEQEFLQAFWEGVDPEGRHYYPAFPYTSYTGVSRDDLLAIRAYLFSLDPVRNETPGHELAWYISSRLAAGAWKFRYFEPGRFVPDETRSEEWNRGAYLVRHLGHCGECHTPRGLTGAPDRDAELAGYEAADGESVPNITPHREDGIGRWTRGDIEYFLDTGMLPDGDYTGGRMSAVIDRSTSHLTREDRLAIATYIRSLPPLPSED